MKRIAWVLAVAMLASGGAWPMTLDGEDLAAISNRIDTQIHDHLDLLAYKIWFYGYRTVTGGTVTTVSGNVNGSVGSVTGSVGSVASPVTVGNANASVWDSFWDDVVEGEHADNAPGTAAALLAGAGSPSSGLTAAQVWGYSPRTITGGSVGSVTGSVGSVTGSVGSVANPVTVGTNNDKTGYYLDIGALSTVSAGVWGYGSRTLSTTPASATDMAAVKAKTDKLNFSQAGYVNAGVYRINGSSVAPINLSDAFDGSTAYTFTGWPFLRTGGSVGSVTGSVGSVTGSVGSVTGSVGSVTGSVGSVASPVTVGSGTVSSVTGSVGSVTGSVGSVTGSVGSVASPVTVGSANASFWDSFWDDVVEGEHANNAPGTAAALLAGGASPNLTAAQVWGYSPRTLSTQDWAKPSDLAGLGYANDLSGLATSGQVAGVSGAVTGIPAAVWSAAPALDWATASDLAGLGYANDLSGLATSGQVAGVSGAVAGVSSAVAGVSSAGAGVGDAVSGVSGQVTGVASTVAGVSGTVAGVSSAVAAVGDAVSGVSGQVAGVAGAVAGVSGQVAEVPTALENATAVWNYANGRTVDNQSNLTPSLIWSYGNRTLTENPSEALLLQIAGKTNKLDFEGEDENGITRVMSSGGGSSNLTAAQVWGYSPRTLSTQDWAKPSDLAGLGYANDLSGLATSGQVTGIPAAVWSAAPALDWATASDLAGLATAGDVSAVGDAVAGVSGQVAGVSGQVAGVSGQVAGVADNVIALADTIGALPEDTAAAVWAYPIAGAEAIYVAGDLYTPGHWEQGPGGSAGSLLSALQNSGQNMDTFTQQVIASINTVLNAVAGIDCSSGSGSTPCDLTGIARTSDLAGLATAQSQGVIIADLVSMDHAIDYLATTDQVEAIPAAVWAAAPDGLIDSNTLQNIYTNLLEIYQLQQETPGLVWEYEGERTVSIDYDSIATNVWNYDLGQNPHGTGYRLENIYENITPIKIDIDNIFASIGTFSSLLVDSNNSIHTLLDTLPPRVANAIEVIHEDFQNVSRDMEQIDRQQNIIWGESQKLPQYVWKYPVRTITDASATTMTLSASDFWAYPQRTLTEQISTTPSITAQAVWSYEGERSIDDGEDSYFLKLATSVWNYLTGTAGADTYGKAVEDIGSANVNAQAVANAVAAKVLDDPATPIANDGDGNVGISASAIDAIQDHVVSSNHPITTDSIGNVTIGTNLDKAGYGLATGQTVGLTPAGLDAVQSKVLDGGVPLNTDANGSVVVSSNLDKTGYALTAAYDAAKSAASPAQVGVAVLKDGYKISADANGKVTVGTNSDKTGYALSTSGLNAVTGGILKNGNAIAADSSGRVTVGVSNDKTGYALTGAYDAAKTAAQATAVTAALTAIQGGASFDSSTDGLYQIRNAVAGTLPKDGAIAVDEDFGGDNVLQIKDALNQPVANAVVVFYRKAEFDAGSYVTRALAMSNSNGYWGPVYLAHGTVYYMVVARPGAEPTTQEVTP